MIWYLRHEASYWLAHSKLKDLSAPIRNVLKKVILKKQLSFWSYKNSAYFNYLYTNGIYDIITMIWWQYHLVVSFVKVWLTGILLKLIQKAWRQWLFQNVIANGESRADSTINENSCTSLHAWALWLGK